VRVLIQTLEEVKRNEKSLCLVARTTSASVHQSPSLIPRVWLPEWLEERPEISEKAKKLYAYLTYFAGGKGYAWPSFNHLAERLHISRRYVIKLVQELSAHRLITATHVNNPAKGRCTNHYRFLWHPWMQTAEDGDFRMVVSEEQAPFPIRGV
jgi:Helix-turn-helix domain